MPRAMLCILLFALQRPLSGFGVMSFLGLPLPLLRYPSLVKAYRPSEENPVNTLPKRGIEPEVQCFSALALPKASIYQCFLRLQKACSERKPEAVNSTRGAPTNIGANQTHSKGPASVRRYIVTT